MSSLGIEVGLLAPKSWYSREWDKMLHLDSGDSSVQNFGGAILFNGSITGHTYLPHSLIRPLIFFRPSIVQIDQEVYSLAALQLASISRLLGKKVITLGPRHDFEPSLNRAQRLARVGVLPLSNLILCSTRSGVTKIRQWGYSGPTELVPNYTIDLDVFHPRKRQEMDSDRLVIGFAGRLVYEKGVDTLLQSLRALKSRGIPAIAKICGSGPYEPSLKNFMRELGVEENVIWTGALATEDMPEAMSQMDVLVVPSRTIPNWKDTFPHVLLEGMAMGIPVVGSNSGAIPELIGRDDVIFPEEDGESLANLLEKMSKSHQWREELSNYGLDRVQKNYSPGVVAERLVGIYRSLEDEHAAGGPITTEMP